MLLEKDLKRYLSSLEAEMSTVVQPTDSRHAELFGMLRYHLGWADSSFEPCHAPSGKRVRPVLCLLTCEGCGGDWEQALPAASAIELLHNFSLIHDDIEDQDHTRRGRATVWSIWGEAQAINAGDAMFTLAQIALLRLVERDVKAKAIVEAAAMFNRTCLALTEGQYLDIGFEGRAEVSTGDYLAMVEGKTAALTACACEMGGLIAEAPQVQRERLHAFGRCLGLSFQMKDDILGIWGDPELTGKPVGADIIQRKKTLPLVHGLARSAELRDLLAQESLSEAELDRAKRILDETGSREYTLRLARENHTQALTALNEAKLREPAAHLLHELAQKLLGRER